MERSNSLRLPVIPLEINQQTHQNTKNLEHGTSASTTFSMGCNKICNFISFVFQFMFCSIWLQLLLIFIYQSKTIWRKNRSAFLFGSFDVRDDIRCIVVYIYCIYSTINCNAHRKILDDFYFYLSAS